MRVIVSYLRPLCFALVSFVVKNIHFWDTSMTKDHCAFHHRTEDSLCACTRKDTFYLIRWQ